MIKADMERLLAEQEDRIRELEAENHRLEGKVELLMQMRATVVQQGDTMLNAAAKFAAVEDEGPTEDTLVPHQLMHEINTVHLSESAMDWRPPGWEGEVSDGDASEQ